MCVIFLQSIFDRCSAEAQADMLSGAENSFSVRLNTRTHQEVYNDSLPKAVPQFSKHPWVHTVEGRELPLKTIVLLPKDTLAYTIHPGK